MRLIHANSDYVSPFDATVGRRLRGHGARITSRNNCDEFAMGGLNKHSLFGPVANPAPYENVNEPDFAKYPPRAPGGSSGGAAAAVRANLCRVYVNHPNRQIDWYRHRRVCAPSFILLRCIWDQAIVRND